MKKKLFLYLHKIAPVQLFHLNISNYTHVLSLSEIYMATFIMPANQHLQIKIEKHISRNPIVISSTYRWAC